jgi:hypothetical protein
MRNDRRRVSSPSDVVKVSAERRCARTSTGRSSHDGMSCTANWVVLSLVDAMLSVTSTNPAQLSGVARSLRSRYLQLQRSRPDLFDPYLLAESRSTHRAKSDASIVEERTVRIVMVMAIPALYF